jgi:acyl-coenzyme A thioesterase PaaI-like protein
MEFWPKLNLDLDRNQNMCFGCGTANPIGLKLKFNWDEKSRTASTTFTPNPCLQGWAGFVHGGIIACILDEVIGWASMFAGTNNVTAKMQVRYRQMLPLSGTYNLSCTIVKQSSRLVETEASITGKDGTVYAEATSTQFIVNRRQGDPRVSET